MGGDAIKKLARTGLRAYYGRKFGRTWAKPLADALQYPLPGAFRAASGALYLPGVTPLPCPTRLAMDVVWTRRELADLGRIAGATYVLRDDHLLARVGPVSMKLTDRASMMVAHEIFAEQVWRFELPGGCLILDVGANVGLASLFFLANYDAEVWAYELVPTTAAMARANLEANPQYAGRWAVTDAGWSDADAEFDIAINPDSRVSNSLYSVEPGNLTTERVRVVDAASVVRQAAGELRGRKLVLKLDAEGAEYEVLPRLAAEGLLGSVDLLLMEWHERDGHDPEELRTTLRASGFVWTERVSPNLPVGFLSAFRA